MIRCEDSAQESVWVIYQSFYPVTLSYKQCIMATSATISRVLAAIYIFTNTSALHANTDTNIITPHHSAGDGTIIQDANNVTRRVNVESEETGDLCEQTAEYCEQTGYCCEQVCGVRVTSRLPK